MKKLTILKVVIALITSLMLTYLAATPVQGASVSHPIANNQDIVIKETQKSFIDIKVLDNIVQEELKKYAEDLRYMAAIIFAEAGNQCEAGQQAVGIVVMNRVICEEYFENDIISVIYEPGQFTPVENGSFIKALELYDAGEMPDSCISAAKYALEGNTTIVYNNSTYDLQDYLFFARYVANRKLIVQDHQFK